MQRLSENPVAARSQSWVGCRLVSAVPPAHRRDGTEWLSIEHCTATKGGYFLLPRRRRDEPAASESWHPTLDAALREAQRDWGVDRACWTVE